MASHHLMLLDSLFESCQLQQCCQQSSFSLLLACDPALLLLLCLVCFCCWLQPPKGLTATNSAAAIALRSPQILGGMARNIIRMFPGGVTNAFYQPDLLMARR